MTSLLSSRNDEVPARILRVLSGGVPRPDQLAVERELTRFLHGHFIPALPSFLGTKQATPMSVEIEKPASMIDIHDLDSSLVKIVTPKPMLKSRVRGGQLDQLAVKQE